jgi:hypothetical protein
MTTQTTMYQFYFKIPYTEQTHDISFNSNLTIKQFIELIDSNFIREYFNIHENYNVETVEAGNNVNGHAELAPALEPSQETLKDKYGNNYHYRAFYIRPIFGPNRIFQIRNDYSINPI